LTNRHRHTQTDRQIDAHGQPDCWTYLTASSLIITQFTV